MTTTKRQVKMMDGALPVPAERMEAFGEWIAALIEQGENERDQHRLRWRQGRDDYENVAIAYVSKIIDNAADVPMPFAQPRADALADFVINSLVSQTPMVKCQVTETDPEFSLQEARGKTLDFLFRVGNIAETLKTIAPSVWCTNHGIVRISYGGPTNPIKAEPILPEDFVCVGAGAYTIQTARCVGHRFHRSRAEIESLVEQGIYEGGDEIEKFVAAEIVSPESEVRHEVASPATRGEDFIELWQVYVIADLKAWKDDENRPEPSSDETRFSLVIEPRSKHILSIEEYPYPTVCYFSFGYKPAPERGFWHEFAVAADMQGPHRAYNCLGNLALYGTTMSAFPPLIAQRGAFAKDQRYSIGGFVNAEAGDVKTGDMRFDLQAVQAELQRLERVGDGVARISSAGIAQQYSKRMTATEVGSIEAGQQAGISAYLETFAAPMQQLCAHAEEILESTFDEWKPLFMANCPVRTMMDFEIPAIWDVPGKMPNLNPTFVVQNIGVLMNIMTQIAGMSEAMGPGAWIFGARIMERALGAMDFQNVEELIEPLKVMGGMTANANQQQPMASGPLGIPGMGPPGMGAGIEAPGALAPVGGF